ncbi:hypothetical protein ABBQ32_003192 [Trebouxia sp. C0010 RCD-2024]
MPKVQPPELKDFMDKRLSGEQQALRWRVGMRAVLRSVVAAVALNANRLVTGVLRGFDQFMNIVLDNTVDEKNHTDIGMVVIRGNSIVTVEVLERL